VQAPLLAGSEELELLARWRAGDDVSGQRLFGRWYSVVSRYLRNKVGGAVHKDLVQQTFEACLRSSASFRGTSSFRSFLLRIAYNKLADYLRSKYQRVDLERQVEVDDLVIADSFASPDSLVARRQEYRILLAGLRRLPFKLQVVLELRYWESLTDLEIAEVIDAPLGTVKTRLRTGHIRLQREVACSDISPDLVRSTMDTLEDWSGRVRDGLRVLEDGG